jgi:succinate dehydrogenase/fumarate reductase cytochrome b subunit
MSINIEVFSPTTSTDKSNNISNLLPASFRDDDLSLLAPLSDTSKFLLLDLSVQRLNDIQEYLWLAGRPMPPRPLNYQISVSRTIIVDEKIDMHLVWGPGRRIHIKPLPPYLLDSRFWAANVTCSTCSCGLNSDRNPAPSSVDVRPSNTDTDTCPRCDLSKSALGFLTSYIALIQYPSDFLIAQAHSLLPASLTWPQWRALVQNLLDNDIMNPDRINRRYRYGELRLSRLNKIYAFQLGSFFRGYRAKYQTYQELFHTYLAPITAMTVYFALVLTAMQVGLATEELAGSQAFQRASYGFTVLSILGPLALVFLVLVVAAAHFAANALATLVFRRERSGFFRRRAGKA